ncbi:MAG: type III effector HopM1 [Gammaproteobacteria bacterium HGW-Gammaproteobacteria-12]|nr:MAG: type III effector HopM1 [Gammaproteobacteria bacterium HGW-Gammaproteobacteria-12]
MQGRQAERAARPQSALERYESAFPGLRELRQKAQREAARQADTDRPAYHPLEAAKRRMLIEGELLRANPSLSLQQASEILNMGHVEQLASPIPYGDSLEKMATALDQLFAPGLQDELPSLVQLGAILDQGLGEISRHLEGQLGLYQQVLQHTALDDTERAQVKAGQQALQALAERWTEDIKGKVLGNALELAESRLQGLQRAQQNPDQVELQTRQWQNIRDYLKSAQDEFDAQGEFGTALQHVRLGSQVEAMNASNQGLFSAMRTFMANGVPPGIASTLLYVMARAYVSPQLAGAEFVGRSLGSGMAIGAVHETLDNFAKPAAREVLASLGMTELREVDPSEVIPDPPRAVIVDGRYQERDAGQMAEAQAEVEQARKAFLNAQQDYKTGTLRGDAITLTSLPGAQAARELVNVLSSQNAASTGAMALAAFLGNAGMYGLQAMGQRQKTFSHEGHDLPTHVPKPAPQEALGQRLGNVFKDGLSTINPLDASVRQKYDSKGWSAAFGMLGYNSVEGAIKPLDTSTTGGAASSVILTGLQTFLMQQVFYANKPAGDEAKAGGTGRFDNALNNIRDPDRETLPHGSRPGTTERGIENTYDRWRGVIQGPPQAATEITEAVTSTVVSGLGQLGRQVAEQASRQQQRLTSEVSTRVFSALSGGLEHVGRQVAEHAMRQRERFRAAEPQVDIEMGLQAPRDRDNA